MNSILRSVLISSVIFVGMLGLQTGLAANEKGYSIGSLAKGKRIPVVSPLVLIANQEKFDGKEIMTEGIVAIGDQSYLFIYQEDFDHFRLINGFTFSLSRKLKSPPGWGKEVDRKRVLVAGTFKANTSKVIYPGGGGAIVDVEYLAIVPEKGRD